jgi:hypothetical protein
MFKGKVLGGGARDMRTRDIIPAHTHLLHSGVLSGGRRQTNGDSWTTS